MSRKAALTLFILTGGLFLAACAAPATPASPAPQPNLPNPASVFCEAHGGTVEIRQDASGGQSGVCVFPDQGECEEWAYFRGDCQPGDSLRHASPTPGDAVTILNPASRYCEKTGGEVEFREDAAGNVTGVCVFPDKSECEEWAFYREECQPGAATAMPRANAGIANPASAYCEGHGGTLEIRQDAAGGLSGVCVFPDQTQCEEWAYFRGECLPGSATP